MQNQELKKSIITAVMVDKEQKLLLVTKKYFSSKTIRIKTASSIAKGRYLLNKFCPDVLIIDIVICAKASENFIEDMHQDLKLKHVPIIFLTARGLTEDRIKGYQSGCNIYLSKPFDPEELESIIINLVEKTKLSTGWMMYTYSSIKKCKSLLNLKKTNQDNYSVTLTRKEKIILWHILEKKTAYDIATTLSTTERHVQQYIARIMDKTMSKTIDELHYIPWYKLL